MQGHSDQFAEALRQSAADLTVVRISPADASALLVRLAHLEAIEQRALGVRDEGRYDEPGPAQAWQDAAAFILGTLY